MKDSAKAGLEQFLTYRLHVLNKLAERGISERYQARLGVTLPEARVIASVGSFGPFSIMELARHANLDKSQASRAAEAMIRQGLVQRRPSAEDGRVVLVSLTPELLRLATNPQNGPQRGPLNGPPAQPVPLGH